MYLGPAEETWFIMHVNKTYDCFMNYITLRSDYGEPDLIIWTKDVRANVKSKCVIVN